MAEENRILWIKTEGSHPPEWSPAIVVIKQEDTDEELKLENEFILKEDDGDSLLVEEVLGSFENEEDNSKASGQLIHPIYQHYVVLNKKDKKRRSAACRYCSKILKQPFSTTTTLVKHMSAKHQPQYQVYMKNKERYDAAKSQKSGDRTERRIQPLVPDLIQSKRKWSSHYPAAKSLSNKLAKFIVKGLHSYSTIDEPDFKEFVREAQPLFDIPDPNTFASQIQDMFEKCHKHVLETVSKDAQTLQAISITTHSWSAHTGKHHYVGVSVQYIDNKFDMMNFSLGPQKLEGKKSASNLRIALETKLSDYNLLSPTIPIYVLTSSGSVLTGAISSLQRQYKNIEARSCFADLLQLVITDVKESVFSLHTLCENARGIAAYFQRSPDARKTLRQLQLELNLPELEVLQDNVFSWNSEYSMLLRLVKIQDPLVSVLVKMDADVHFLSQSEWDTIKTYVTLLKPLFEAMTEISNSTTSTSSLIYFIIWSVKKSWNKYLSSCVKKERSELLAKQLLRCLLSKFQNAMLDSVNVLAMILDPRFKVSLLAQGDERNHWLKILKTEASPQSHLTTNNEEVGTQLSVTPTSSSEEDDSLWSFMDEVAQSNNATLSQINSPIEAELEHYLTQKVLPRDAEPLKFWGDNCHLYPLLARLAKKYLSVPAVQMTSEHQNSVAGVIISDRRSSLSPEYVEQFVFLQENS